MLSASHLCYCASLHPSQVNSASLSTPTLSLVQMVYLQVRLNGAAKLDGGF